MALASTGALAPLPCVGLAVLAARLAPLVLCLPPPPPPTVLLRTRPANGRDDKRPVKDRKSFNVLKDAERARVCLRLSLVSLPSLALVVVEAARGDVISLLFVAICWFAIVSLFVAAACGKGATNGDVERVVDGTTYDC